MGMGFMGFAPTWLRQVSPLLHMTTLTTASAQGRTRLNWRSQKKHVMQSPYCISCTCYNLLIDEGSQH